LINKENLWKKSTYNNIIDDNFDSVKNESSSIDNVSEKENKFDNIPVFSLDFPKDIIKKDNLINEMYAVPQLTETKIHVNSIDILQPLYDNQDYLLFGQFGIQRVNQGEKNISFGLGKRTFYKDYLFGYNAFYDTQLSEKKHHRLGIGGEFCCDSLYFSINGYCGLNGWKSSSFEDYEKCIANGYDFYIHSRVLTCPQLSGKIKFEQCFGNKIDFPHTSVVTKNPSLLTLSIDYNPIPLFTFSIDNEFNDVQYSNTRFNISLNYRLGIPFSKQIDSNVVGTPSGNILENRQFLVERNNDIIFKSRKKFKDDLKSEEMNQPSSSNYEDVSRIFDSDSDTSTGGNCYSYNIIRNDPSALFYIVHDKTNNFSEDNSKIKDDSNTNSKFSSDTPTICKIESCSSSYQEKVSVCPSNEIVKDKVNSTNVVTKESISLSKTSLETKTNTNNKITISKSVAGSSNQFKSSVSIIKKNKGFSVKNSAMINKDLLLSKSSKDSNFYYFVPDARELREISNKMRRSRGNDSIDEKLERNRKKMKKESEIAADIEKFLSRKFNKSSKSDEESS